VVKHNNHSNRAFGKKKAAAFTALAFFLCHPLPGIAQTNVVTGNATVYGNVATNLTIVSKKAGIANLGVYYGPTSRIDLKHAIGGQIAVSNQFDSFLLDASLIGASLSPSNTTALTFFGGTNLTIKGGSFAGGKFATATNDWNNTYGGLVSGVETTKIANARFIGGTITVRQKNDGPPPLPGQGGGFQFNTPIAIGADGLVAIDSHVILTDNSSVQGGAGGKATTSQGDANGSGGNGFSLYDSTSIISNGTFQGGAGGSAEVAGNAIATANGGHGLFASNSTVEIVSGDFIGGEVGSIKVGGVAFTPQGGSGLVATDGARITIHGGTFESGGAYDYSVALKDSDLTMHGGTFADGLYGETSDGGTNRLDLWGGSISNISFVNGLYGVQLVAISNTTVAGEIRQVGGRVAIDNRQNDGLQNIVVVSGNMAFSNDLSLGSGGTFTLGSEHGNADFQSLEIGGGAMLDLNLGGIGLGGDLTLSNGAHLASSIVAGKGGRIVYADRILFLGGAKMSVNAEQAGLATGSKAIALADATNGLFVDGVAATESNFNAAVDLQVDVIGRTVFDNVAFTSNSMALLFYTKPLGEYWNATGQFAALANELDEIGNTEMLAAIDQLDDPAASAQAVEQTYLTTLNTFQTALRGLDAAVGQAISRGTEFREELRLPKGSRGPGETTNDWRFWGKYVGQFISHDAIDQNSAYDATLHGGVVGVDKSFGHLLLGFSGGMGRNRIEADNNFRQDMNAANAAIYSTIGKRNSYLDASVAYGYNGVESRTAEPFVLNGDYDTHLFSGRIGGGLGFGLPTIGTIITPEASAQYTRYMQEAYAETGTAAVPRSFDSFDADSLRSSLGLNIAMLNTKGTKNFSFKVEGRAHWLHEFNPETGDLTFQLQGGTGYDYTIAYPLLDEDAARLGIGFTFFNTARRKPRNVMLRLDFDELIGKDFNSHNLSAKAIYAF
jgi:outer membrane autotransporter protein